MDSDFEDETEILQHKRRRVDNTDSNASSVSTTVPLSSSGNGLSSSSSSKNYLTPIKQHSTKRSRKRKFNDVFMADNQDNDNDNNVDRESDEDIDLKSDLTQKLMSNVSNNRPIKRARLDTPTVQTNAYFDPINLHNDHCPFVRQHTYQQNKIFGWKYCLKLLPKDIMYIKQLIDEQNKKSNQAVSRY